MSEFVLREKRTCWMECADQSECTRIPPTLELIYNNVDNGNNKHCKSNTYTGEEEEKEE